MRSGRFPQGNTRCQTMQLAAPRIPFSSEGFAFGWESTLDRLIAETEAAELGLASNGGQRKDSGSFYTPADVASHFWDLFLRHHAIDNAAALRAFIGRAHFVEPSAGSGIFVFSFLRKALALGLSPREIAAVRFHVIDINLAALSFFKRKLKELSNALGVTFDGIGCDQIDFLDWATNAKLTDVAFVGNPPFVSNVRGSKWRNLYADFLETMLCFRYRAMAISLILPVSICFSRDYADLRQFIDASGLAISASSYDNIPDCLFKSGKPESTNTNRANSQRCTILNLGGPCPGRREAASMQRWATSDRARVLGSIPTFRNYMSDGYLGQIPRPESDRIMAYLARTSEAKPLRTMLSKHGGSGFAIGSVARNFIGVRDAVDGRSGVIPIRPASGEDGLRLLQILASGLFLDYWRTLGDGFHVTNELIECFPVTPDLLRACERNRANARRVWEVRHIYAKEKLNSGKIIRSYDFRGAFGHALV